jgi:GNAT superfamily N-acetyltransferase
MEYEIRRGTAADALETAAVFSASLKSMSFFPKLHTDAEDKTFIARLILKEETWLATKDDRIVGFACLEGNRLAHLYIDPTHHDLGAGTALLSYVKTRRPDGFDLWCFQANTGARRFYERHGCVAVEFADGAGNEEKLPDVRYEWRG